MNKQKMNNIPYLFKNEVSEDVHEITISGVIGKSNMFYNATGYDDIRNALQDNKADTVRIKISSGGGDAFEGIAIYNYLKDLKAHVIVEVVGLSASAASIITMGADEIIMRTGTNLMIHEASTMAYGTKQDIQKTLNGLESIDDSIIDIYQQKTGLSSDEIHEMMKAETWFTPQQALEKGFIDKIETVEPIEETTKENIISEAFMNDLVTRLKNELLTEDKQAVTQAVQQNTDIEKETNVITNEVIERKRFLF